MIQFTGAKLYTTAECLAEIRSEAAMTAATLTIDDVLVRTPTDEGLEFGMAFMFRLICINMYSNHGGANDGRLPRAIEDGYWTTCAFV